MVTMRVAPGCLLIHIVLGLFAIAFAMPPPPIGIRNDLMPRDPIEFHYYITFLMPPNQTPISPQPANVDTKAMKLVKTMIQNHVGKASVKFTTPTYILDHLPRYITFHATMFQKVDGQDHAHYDYKGVVCSTSGAGILQEDTEDSRADQILNEFQGIR